MVVATVRRTAPDEEFVRMYRSGTPASKIAATEGVAETTARYHLQIAARTEPGLRDEHQAALARIIRYPAPSQRKIQDTLTFYKAEGRRPGTHGKTPRERSLAVWLLRERKEAAAGSLSPAYRDSLVVIPNWDRPSTRKAEDAARWQQRLEEIARLREGRDHRGPKRIT